MSHDNLVCYDSTKNLAFQNRQCMAKEHIWNGLKVLKRIDTIIFQAVLQINREEKGGLL